MQLPFIDQHKSFGYFAHIAHINKLVYYIYFSLFEYEKRLKVTKKILRNQNVFDRTVIISGT